MPPITLSLSPCDVNILIVVDGDVRFNKGTTSGRGSLSLLIDALQERAGPLVRFNIKTAYRPRAGDDVTADDRGANFPNFNFKSQESELDNFDQVWLFGHVGFNANTAEPPNMTNDEIKALFDRMELKLGVFATGDHEDLGAAMNSRIPRVRSMRRWRMDIAPEFRAASANGANRRDTLRKNADNIYRDENESDHIPQDIVIVEFSDQNSSVKYAHPLLSGESGNIEFLPDHMHEGECCAPPIFVPTDPPFDNFEKLEYPTIDGIKIEPQIVAQSRIPEAHETISGGQHLPVVQPTEFGIIAVYDGHTIGKGRVVVGSTFHHFINSNLEGFSTGNRTIAGQGLFAYEDIKNYFRNIGIWLSPKEKQRTILRCALWEVRWRSGLFFKLKNIPDTFAPNSHSPLILELGTAARSALDNLASASLILEWTLNLISEFKIGSSSMNLNIPWAGLPPPSETTTNLDLGKVVNAVLGGIVYSLARRFPGEEQVDTKTMEELITEIEKALKDGVITGVQSFQEHLKKTAGNLVDLSEGFSKAFNLAETLNTTSESPGTTS